MEKQRADLGFGDDVDIVDPAEWSPSAPVHPRPDPEETTRAAEVAGFRRREPLAIQPPYSVPPDGRAGQGRPRRRRTGRNAQLNLKARPETIDAYIAIADRQGWGLGETLEHAVAVLEERFAAEDVDS